jgi:hypothetical protein
MAAMDYLRFIAWIALLFWGIWAASVQLERLDSSGTSHPIAAVIERACERAQVESWSLSHETI